MKYKYSSIITLYLTETENRTKTNLQHSFHTIALGKGTIFAKKADFLQKNADIKKIKRGLILKGIFSETKYVCVYFRVKFEVSSIILTSFRQE